jgi:hypothetical protein
MEIYDIIKDRLPSTYPRPTLAFYEDEQTLSNNMRMKLADDTNLYAVCDPETNTVMMPMNMTFTYESLGPTGNLKRRVPINKMDEEEIAATLLHEIAHLYFGKKYGYSSKQYSDEQACDRFAYRWVRKMVKEKLL